MGWNSWDSYGTTIDEAHFRASAAWVAEHLKPYGYEYVAIDMEWFDADPVAEGNKPNMQHAIDANGRYLPDPARFPSSADGAGFAPIAAYVHSLGLKFGIHILQGIPKQAVAANSRIWNSDFRAKDAANQAAGCKWNPDNFDLQSTSAGQAYYNSIAQLYASWKVDLIKIDCIAAGPYKGDEIRMFHQAIVNSGRAMVLSLSPGEAPIDQTANLQRYSQQWRISNDIWDLWHSGQEYPQGVNDQFPRAAKWLSARQDGHWPDADMLPLGRLGPAPGWGKPRDTRLTHDEQRTLMNLWCIFRSPLMYGGDPAATDDWTLSLLTNRDVIGLDQQSQNTQNPMLTDALAVWTADDLTRPRMDVNHFVAVFNRLDTEQTVKLTWPQIGLPRGPYRTVDLWTKQETPGQLGISVRLAPHASILLQLFAGSE